VSLDCTNHMTKVGYQTAAAANLARQQVATPTSRHRFYRCPECGFYFLILNDPCAWHRGKTPHPTEEHAHVTIRRIASEGRGQGSLHARQCQGCGYWFLYNEKKRRAIKARYRDLQAEGVA
jgi:DNA-directed RNA polymerase subunit RPC12/RpoP